MAIEKIEEAESTRESIKFLSYLEAAIDKISIHLDELKASMYLELCDRLKNLASQERDYFTEKKIPNLAGNFQNKNDITIEFCFFYIVVKPLLFWIQKDTKSKSDIYPDLENMKIDDTDRIYFKIFKGAKEIELLRKCDQILRSEFSKSTINNNN